MADIIKITSYEVVAESASSPFDVLEEGEGFYLPVESGARPHVWTEEDFAIEIPLVLELVSDDNG